MSTRAFSAPAQHAIFEYEEKRSRFIAFVFAIDSKKQILSQLHELKQQYPDARHYCWAYLLGHPEQANAAGFNDDGEPGGTAGKPMLNVLMQRKIGNAGAVVVRYFGGIKLGAGRLTRAYSSAVSGAVDKLVLTTIYPKVRFEAIVPFAMEERLRMILAKVQATVSSEYGTDVTLSIMCDTHVYDQLQQEITNACAGQVIFRD